MIVAVAFCPHPPVLVPQVAQQAAVELDELRAACRAAITRIASPDRRIVVIGSAERAARFAPGTRGTFAGFGVDLEVTLGAGRSGGPGLPLSLTVGAWLLRDALGADVPAEGVAVGPDGDVPGAEQFADDDVALLVMGDGSARRSTAAPGYLDERAEDFDAGVVAALRSGRGASLARDRIDADLGADLLAAGAPAWNAVGVLVGDRDFEGEVLYDAAPYGVGYAVATWT